LGQTGASKDQFTNVKQPQHLSVHERLFVAVCPWERNKMPELNSDMAKKLGRNLCTQEMIKAEGIFDQSSSR
jgi:hypothetical protein